MVRVTRWPAWTWAPLRGSALSGEGGWAEISGCPLITNDDDNVAVRGMTDILTANSDLTAFLSTGAFTQWFDNAYRQAAEPYKAKMDSGELTIVVADTLPMQLEQTKDGLGNGLVGQHPYEMGYKAMYVLKDIVERKSVAIQSNLHRPRCLQQRQHRYLRAVRTGLN